MPETILIADDDQDGRDYMKLNLSLEGFSTLEAEDGQQALEIAIAKKPDLVLLDAMMPKMDGFEVCRRLRRDVRTAGTGIIMVTGRSLSSERVVGLTAGADDYIVKPFDPMELIARVRTTLRRSREMRDVNPLTGIPGNAAIQAELQRRIMEGEPFGLMYVDLDNFKAYNDHYGFARGDTVLMFLSSILQHAVVRFDPENAFIGHIGGDDFALMCRAELIRTIGEQVISEFDKGIGALYDPRDRDKGFITVVDRRDQAQDFPIVSVSIGVASNVHRKIGSHWEASEIATETKHFAKKKEGSTLVFDRRTSVADRA